MSDPGATATLASHAPPALVVYGRDDGGKPHASVFADSEADLAEMAAGLMGMRAFRLAEPEHLDGHLATVDRLTGCPKVRERACGVRVGRKAGGKFVPFLSASVGPFKAAVYDRLTALWEAAIGQETCKRGVAKRR